jgi:hypothetical protein
MMKLRTLLTIASVTFLLSSSAEAKSWRGIEPLHSIRTDVERLLGSKVVRCGGSSCIYELDEEIVFVLYATDSSCKNDDATSSWKVPVGTVIEIGVHFKKNKPLSQLGFDLSKFEKIKDEHQPGWIYYVNLEEGVRVEGGLETASSVTYFQSAKDNQFHCPSADNKNQDKVNYPLIPRILHRPAGPS